MQKRTLRGIRQYQIGSKSLLVLKYYMTERPTNSGENYYGIEISQQKITQGVEEPQKCNHLLLSETKDWVEELMDKFIGNGVTPDTMEYIIDDIMGIPC